MVFRWPRNAAGKTAASVSPGCGKTEELKICLSGAVQPQASHLGSLCLSVLFFKNGGLRWQDTRPTLLLRSSSLPPAKEPLKTYFSPPASSVKS